MVDQLGGQKVQEFWVRGARTVFTEVARRVDDPRTEVELPKSVDDHSWRERVGRAGDPVSQREPSMLLRSVDGQVEVSQRAHRVWSNLLPFGGRFTSVESVRGTGLSERSGIGHDWFL